MPARRRGMRILTIGRRCREFLRPAEQYWVMRDNHVRPFADSFFDNIRRDRQAGHHAVRGVGGIAEKAAPHCPIRPRCQMGANRSRYAASSATVGIMKLTAQFTKIAQALRREQNSGVSHLNLCAFARNSRDIFSTRGRGFDSVHIGSALGADMPTESAHRPLTYKLLQAIRGPGEATDRELIARFVRSRDEEAFAEVVRRHGRMVLAVGRRVTGHPQDAEDAFQAAFLVLARRAAHVNRPEQLANWLYGVAYRTALEARAARRRVLEQSVSAAPEPAAPSPSDDTTDLRRVIDEELEKLPDKYRAAIVLCDLEGLPRAEAAVRLKIPEGTLSSRLAHARKVLANRLTRRGINSTAGAIAVALGRDALCGTVPRELILHTAKAAARMVGSGTIPPDLVSPSVYSLTEGALRAMLAYRLRISLSGVLVAGTIGLGAFGLAQAPPASVPQLPPDVVSNEPVQNPAEPFSDPIVAQQPKVEKVEPKGIEDEEVPYPATPTQAIIRIEDGKLIVRQRVYHVASAHVHNIPGQPSGMMQRKSNVRASIYDPADIAVFDMKGNRLLPKAWKEKLKTDVHALVGFDGRLPNPRELGLFKDDTLIVVLPAGSGGATYGDTLAPLTTSTAPFAQPGGAATVYPPSGYPTPSVQPPAANFPVPMRPPSTPRPGRPTATPPGTIPPDPSGGR